MTDDVLDDEAFDGTLEGQAIERRVLGRLCRLCTLLALFFALGSLHLFLAVAGNIFVRLAYQRPFVNLQASGTLGDVGGSYDGVGDDADGADDVVDGLCALDGVLHVLQHQFGLELYEVRLVGLDILFELLGGMFACKRVGIVAVGQQQHLDVHTLCQQHVRSSHSSVDTGFVAVVE